MEANKYQRKLGMIGLGRLGLSIALCFERRGYEVFGYDTSLERTNAVNAKRLDSREPGVAKMLAESTRLLTLDTLEELVSRVDVIYVSVATPTLLSGSFDCETVSQVLVSINELQVRNKHIVLCSTVPPQYTYQVGFHLLRDCENTTLSYVPDGAVPLSYGTLLEHISHPKILLIGEGNQAAGDYIEWLHMGMIDTPQQTKVCRMSPTSAEIAKLASSSFSALRISFANFLCQLSERTDGANAHDVLAALKCDARFGKAFLRPGMGFGGPCIPRDNSALIVHGNEVGVNTEVLRSAQTMNEAHAHFMADMLIANAKDKQHRIVIENVAFKDRCATNLIDESRKLEVAKILVKRGYTVLIRDRTGVIAQVRKRFGRRFDYEELNDEEIAQQRARECNIRNDDADEEE